MSSSTEKPRHPSDSPIPFPDIYRTIGPRLPDAEYLLLPSLLAMYKSYLYRKGYSIMLADNRDMKKPNKLGRRTIYRCDRWRKPQDRKNKNLYLSRKRIYIGSRKYNCPFLIEAQELPSGKWRGRILEENHNYDSSD